MSSGLEDAELLARLVAFDTTSSKTNLPLVEFLADYLERPGVRIRVSGYGEPEKANLLVELGPETDPQRRDGLLLSGHVDVVPPGEGWDSDPFALTDRDDRWVARGACDMKGFVALAVNLATELDLEALRRPLALLFTCDEELGTLGAQHWVESVGDAWPLPRATLIGEPTSLRAVRMHKGHLKLRATLHGRPAHSSQPRLGHNAIESAGRAIAALSRLRDELAFEQPEHAALFPEAPHVTLNIGLVRGGSAINVVPERCELDLGLRPLPGMASAPLVERVRQALASTGEPCELTVLGDSPPLLCPAEAPIHRQLRALLAQPEDAGASFASDAGPFQALGQESILFGPGAIAVAHRPNEFVPKAEMQAARGIVRRLIHDFCEAPA
jgi:acetylornithine deacetylase